MKKNVEVQSKNMVLSFLLLFLPLKFIFRQLCIVIDGIFLLDNLSICLSLPLFCLSNVMHSFRCV